MDRIFVHLPGEGGSVLVNLLQVVQTGNINDDEFVLHMSDGRTINLHGKELVKNVLILLCDHAMRIDGKPMRLKGLTGGG